ncbi:M28 family metallopeptidase [Nemorincola caseinilytica]|uniref:Carboxypeptidase Q n=1 Tax=Nemorincola caseinilytica TaxID=2054315 RepID=A0ABP8N4F6_9BACT
MRKIAKYAVAGAAIISMSFRGDNAGQVDMHTVSLIKNEGFRNSQVMNTLFELTDVNGPRLTGSQGMYTAELWAAKQLKKWGMQNVHIERWGGFGKGWQIDKSYIAMREPYYQPLIGVPRAWTPGTEGMLRGDAILVRIEKLEDMAQYSGKLRGKMVVLSTLNNETKPNFTADARRLTDEELHKMEMDNHTEEVATNLSRKAQPGRPRVNLRPQIDSFLMEEGAIAVLSGGRGTMGTVFTSNGASRKWDAKPVLPEMEMGNEHLAILGRLLDAGKKVTLEMDSWTSFITTDSTEYNVIAEIPGTDPQLKDEVVMLGAHLDSWHASTGATDNGTGSAVMMEAIRILKAIGAKPRRTIRLALWSGEEQGLLGSRGYVKKHFGDRLTMKLKPGQKMVSAYYNLDNGGGKIRGIFAQENDEVRSIFAGWLAPFADLGATTVTLRNTGSTDHISFDEVGIPGFQFIQDPLEYGTRTHHTNMDSYDRVSANDLQQASVIVASFVYHTAMRTQKLPRKPLPKVNKAADSYRR